MLPRIWLLILAVPPSLLPAQDRSDFQQILERLDRLEKENHNLAEEVHALRAEIGGARLPEGGSSAPEGSAAAAAPVNVSSAPLAERVAVEEQRTEELSQTKVEAAQRLPVTLTGMLLFNAFLNSRPSGGAQDPLLASPSDSSRGGAGLSQSVIGLRFHGPTVLGGGKIRASIDLDLWGGSSSSLNHLLRMRVATIQIDWKNTSISAGQDKPLIAQRDPDSLAQVAFSPLTAAGNLWLWQPQARFEQRFALGEHAGVRAQASLYQTSEPSAGVAPPYQPSLSASSPALEGRVEFWMQPGAGARLEIAPGFHASETHIDRNSIPSRLFAIDWLLQPSAKWRLTGTFFTARMPRAWADYGRGSPFSEIISSPP